MRHLRKSPCTRGIRQLTRIPRDLVTDASDFRQPGREHGTLSFPEPKVRFPRITPQSALSGALSRSIITLAACCCAAFFE